jgi:SAM-dependent methyltransferase
MAAIEWVLSRVSLPARVCDVAAGTGALSRLLEPRVGQPVLAVEPDVRMAAVLVSRVPNVLAVQGWGEALPWSDGSLDALLMGSAWHWMDPLPTLAEIARVLRPNGVFGIIGNGPDREVGWVAELFDHRPTRSDGPGDSDRRDPPGRSGRLSVPEVPPGMPFTDPEATVMHYSRPMTRRELVGMAGTYSSIITLPSAERRVRLAAAERQATDAVGGAEADEGATVELPLRCRCWRTVRS